jgi:hypothetical protein
MQRGGPIQGQQSHVYWAKRMNEEWKLTEHIRFLTEGMASDHYIIMDLKNELKLARELMTEEQLKELRELLLKAQQHKQGETK